MEHSTQVSGLAAYVDNPSSRPKPRVRTKTPTVRSQPATVAVIAVDVEPPVGTEDVQAGRSETSRRVRPKRRDPPARRQESSVTWCPSSTMGQRSSQRSSATAGRCRALVERTSSSRGRPRRPSFQLSTLRLPAACFSGLSSQG